MPVTDSNSRHKFATPSCSAIGKTITLFVEGEQEPVEIVTGKASMWERTCRELLKKEIGLWLLKAKLAPCPTRHPPAVVLVERSAGVFEARLP